MASNTLGLAVFLDPTRHEKVRSAVRAIDSWFEHEWLACAQPATSKKPQTL
jgi:hypothetical protein